MGATHFDLQYCNGQADKLFKAKLSRATRYELRNGQYLIMQNRCLREMQGGAQEDAAWNLRREEAYCASGREHSLESADAGLNILTLEEAI